MFYKIYIAGRMSGLKNYNFDEFFNTESFLLQKGHKVINPARLSLILARKMHIKDLKRIPRKMFIKQDLEALLNCNAIFMLEGWEDSVGAKLEHEIARQLDIKIFYKRGEL